MQEKACWLRHHAEEYGLNYEDGGQASKDFKQGSDHDLQCILEKKYFNNQIFAGGLETGYLEQEEQREQFSTQ